MVGSLEDEPTTRRYPAPSCLPSGDDVVEGRDAPEHCYRHGDGATDRANKINVCTLKGTISIHILKNQFSRPGFNGLDRCVHGCVRRNAASQMTIPSRPAAPAPLYIQTHDCAAAPYSTRDIRYERRSMPGRVVQDDLLNAKGNDSRCIVQGAHPSAVREGHEALRRTLLEERPPWAPLLPCSIYVKQYQFIHFLLVEDLNRIDNISNVSPLPEALSFPKTSTPEEEAGDQTWKCQEQISLNRLRRRIPKLWLFSGWNWTPKMLPCSTVDAIDTP